MFDVFVCMRSAFLGIVLDAICSGWLESSLLGFWIGVLVGWGLVAVFARFCGFWARLDSGARGCLFAGDLGEWCLRLGELDSARLGARLAGLCIWVLVVLCAALLFSLFLLCGA